MYNAKSPTGFTMFETIISIGIIGVVAAASFGTIPETRERAAMSDATATIQNALEKTRNNSISGVGTLPHGVLITSNTIAEFEGTSSVPIGGAEQRLPGSISTNQEDTVIVFNRFSGIPSKSAEIVITNSRGMTRTITLSSYGTITTY